MSAPLHSSDGSPVPELASVLMVVPTWRRDGGVSAHVQASARLLASRGLNVHVLAAQVDPGEPLAGLTVHRSPGLFNSREPASSRLDSVLSLEPDVVHFHQVDDPDLVEVAQRHAPALISTHAYTACTSGQYYLRPGQECKRPHGPGCLLSLGTRHCSPGFPRKQIPGRYGGRTRRLRALERADLVISYSRSVDRHLAANRLTKRRVIPLFTTLAVKARRAEAGRRSVLFAGRMVKVKGFDVLLRAARSVDAEFVVCGDGRQLENARGLARRLGVERRIRFEGWLEPGQLAQELADASVVVVPSVWPEPFGLIGIEALAAGRPVIASATGGILDWLEPDVTGLGVPAGDAAALACALNDLLDDPARQDAMGAAGRRMVAERFSPESHLKALLDCYTGAVATAGYARPRPVSLR